MSEELHFGHQKNHHICSCSRHYGCGEWTPEKRAAMNKRMVEKLWNYATPFQKAFVADWERWHGSITLEVK
jgi:hypothetical protein